MDEEEKVIERLMLMEQWKVSGDICTREELQAIGQLLDLYKELKTTLEQTQKSWYEDTKIIEKQKQMINDLIEEELECEKEVNKLERMVELMAEHLTSPTNGKDWVIKYFEDEVELENGEHK